MSEESSVEESKYQLFSRKHHNGGKSKIYLKAIVAISVVGVVSLGLIATGIAVGLPTSSKTNTTNTTTNTTTTTTTRMMLTSTTTTTTTPCASGCPCNSVLVTTLTDTRCVYQNQSFVFMLANFTKRFTLTSYGGNGWGLLSGFEQIVNIYGVATYYLIDYNSVRVVIFDKNWNYQTFIGLPGFSNPWDLKSVGVYFFISSNSYFYRTDSSFNYQTSYAWGNAYYRQIYYDRPNVKLYVSAYNINQIHVFSPTCSLLQQISLSFSVHGLNYYNGYLFGSQTWSNQVAIFVSGVVSSTFTVPLCTTNSIQSIGADSFGYLAVGCPNSNKIFVYDYNGIYQNVSLNANTVLKSEFDSSGRFVVLGITYLDIYY